MKLWGVVDYADCKLQDYQLPWIPDQSSPHSIILIYFHLLFASVFNSGILFHPVDKAGCKFKFFRRTPSQLLKNFCVRLKCKLLMIYILCSFECYKGSRLTLNLLDVFYLTRIRQKNCVILHKKIKGENWNIWLEIQSVL